jgi:hypothetical protein
VRNGEHMKPRITVITIGVDDLEASLRFYREGLGFPTEGIVGKQFEYGAVVSFSFNPACVSLCGLARASVMTPGLP